MKTIFRALSKPTAYALLALMSGNAMAALSGTLTLSGTVAANTAILVTPQGNYNSLNLFATQTNHVVALVNELNNTAAGYTVTLSSANAGKLVSGAFEFAYTARYNASSVALTVSPVTITTQGAQSVVVNTNKNFDISYTGAAADTLMAGTYTDTLTFTIASQ
jgi:hypothetical protein